MNVPQPRDFFYMSIQYSKNRILIIILWAGLLVGSLDILAAFIQFYIRTHHNPQRILLYIASSVFGKEAYEGKGIMIVWGLIIHFMVAYAFTVFLFIIYPVLFQRINKIAAGILYGIFIWVVMNMLILPMTKVSVAKQIHAEQIIAGMLILVVAVGIPLTFIARHYYKNVSRN